jgi:predicted amidohydrolase YtcJ
MMNLQKLKIEIENNLIKSVVPSDKTEIIFNGESKIFSGFAIPGLTDAHCHLWGLGMIMTGPNLGGLQSVDDCLEELKKYSPNKGQWLTGRGWNHELWPGKELPNAGQLDSLFPDIPVSLIRVDGHSIWVNSKAMEIAGVNSKAKSPAGGEIIRDKAGNPTGVFIDNARDLIEKHIPPYTNEQWEEMITVAADECARNGLTAIHDMDVHPPQIPVFTKLAENGTLKLRTRSYISAQNDEYLKAGIEPFEKGIFKCAGIKFFVDGALGSRGAALIEPYSDDPGNYGLLLLNEHDLFTKAMAGIEKGFEIATHAIGDMANRIVLNAYGKIRKKGIDSVLRIEHAQHVRPDDIELFRKYNVHTAIQPIHCTSDAPMAETRLGRERCEQTGYMWKSLIEAGVNIMGSSDFPIEPHNPFTGLDAYVNRIPRGMTESWFPKEKITLENALKSYTEWTVIDEKRGKIEPGFLADLTVISGLDESNLLSTEVEATIVDGKITFQANP